MVNIIGNLYGVIFGIKELFQRRIFCKKRFSKSVFIIFALELFFANQVGAVMSLTMPKQGDFMADGKYLFEVGGSRKTFNQIANQPDSYLAIDDIEMGGGNRIPLWMFGCLY